MCWVEEKGNLTMELFTVCSAVVVRSTATQVAIMGAAAAAKESLSLRRYCTQWHAPATASGRTCLKAGLRRIQVLNTLNGAPASQSIHVRVNLPDEISKVGKGLRARLCCTRGHSASYSQLQLFTCSHLFDRRVGQPCVEEGALAFTSGLG